MATLVAQRPLPLVRDLSLVFRLSDATGTLLAASSIAGLLYGLRGWWHDQTDDLQTFAYTVGFIASSTLRVWFLECVANEVRR